MKRLVFATTSLVVAGGMAAADVEVSGSAELGVSGAKGADAKLHRDIRVKFGLSGETDTGLSFGASADFHNAGKYRAGGTEGAVHVSGAFGTLTLGNTDGAFDKALTEVGSATAIADDHTGHPGYNGNSGLDGGPAGNPGGILRYDYSIGGVTASVSGEFNETDSKQSAIGAGVAWSGDLGGISIGVGLGYQTGKSVESVDEVAASGDDRGFVAHDQSHKNSIFGGSVSADMGNGLSVTANFSSRTNSIDIGHADAAYANDDVTQKITHSAVGIAYSMGDLTVGINGGRSTTKTTSVTADVDGTTLNPIGLEDGESKKSGMGAAVVYNLGTGVAFQVGIGSGKDGNTKSSSWSAGLAFSF